MALPFVLLRTWTIVAAAGAMTLFLASGSDGATDLTNTGSGDWSATGTWDPPQVPAAGDNVTITNGNVLLAAETDELASFQITGGTLTMSNWTTRLRATTVTITNTGTITLPGAFTTNSLSSNRVWIACSNLTLAGGAKIDVDGKGWAGATGTVSDAGHGPGAGLIRKAAAGYGGSGGRQEGAGITGAQPWGSLPYGSATEPTDPGSGGSSYSINAAYSGGAGGGAVRIDATGLVTVNGVITANGKDATVGSTGCGGSGGSVYIECNALQGSGRICVDGGKPDSVKASSGGGRIAVKYIAAAQSLLAIPSIAFSAAAPTAYTAPGEIGTLHFTDNQFLYRSPLSGITGQWSSADANIGFSSLTMSNAWIRFVSDGIHVTVTNELLLKNGARLELGGNTINPEWWWDYTQAADLQAMARPMSEMTSNPRLDCGSLTLTNGGALWVFAGTSTSAVPTGAVVNVTGTVKVFTNSWVYPVAHLTNGGAVLFALGGLTIQQGGGFNADGLGYGCPRNNVKTIGYGPGRGRYESSNFGYYQGGGYGGFGGGYTNAFPSYGITNGSATLPLSCGSAGGAAAGVGSLRSGSGGGLVWIEAPTAIITVGGTISANGGDLRGGSNNDGGAASGGGIYIRCKGITGASGVIRANGGNVNPAAPLRPSASGGGGRIAIWRTPALDTFAGTYSRAAGTGGQFNGTEGTFYAGEFVPSSGSVLHIY